MFKYEQVSNLPMKTHGDQCLLGKKGIKKGLCDTSPNRRKHGGLAPKPPAGTSSLFSTLDSQEEKKDPDLKIAIPDQRDKVYNFTIGDKPPWTGNV